MKTFTVKQMKRMKVETLLTKAVEANLIEADATAEREDLIKLLDEHYTAHNEANAPEEAPKAIKGTLVNPYKVSPGNMKSTRSAVRRYITKAMDEPETVLYAIFNDLVMVTFTADEEQQVTIKIGEEVIDQYDLYKDLKSALFTTDDTEEESAPEA